MDRIFRTTALGTSGLLFLLFLQCTGKARSVEVTALHNACHFLWSAQDADGGWHSETHGIMRSGESLTPFIFVVLMNVSPGVFVPSQHKVDLAMEFIRNNVRSKINRDSLPQVIDYPNYTAAYDLKALLYSAQPEDSVLVAYLTSYLVAQQFAEERGIDSLHPAYGGWGFGEMGLKYGATGHVDISHTRRILEAMRMTLPRDHPAFHKAKKYLSRVQNDVIPGDTIHAVHLDGGFFTSLVTPETNKSLPIPDVDDAWHSYATATCDGLLALRAAGIPDDDTRVEQAITWLDQHSELRYPEGIPLDDPLQWHLVMKYYHLAIRAETLRLLNCEGTGQQISRMLISEQRHDGSFMNPMGAPNKEDDPLLATAFAITALHHVILYSSI